MAKQTPTIQKLYNGEVEIKLDGRHVYTIDGKKVDGVTTVIGVINKPALMFWAVNEAIDHLKTVLAPQTMYSEEELIKSLDDAKTAHRRIKKEAADIGTIVHDWIENWIAHENPLMPNQEQAQNAIKKFLKWVDEHNVKFLENERFVYSRKLNYAGTLDDICIIDGKIKLVDTKTSNGIYDEYWLQTAGYHQAYVEEKPESIDDIEGHVIVGITKDEGEIQIEERGKEDIVKNIEAFNASLILYRRLQEMKKTLKGGDK